jgi:RND family efflux transporter MFP subunit
VQVRTQLKKYWKLLLVFIVVIGGGFLWYTNTQKAKEVTQTFVTPVRQDVVKTLEISGVVDAKKKARLRFLAGGKVVYVGAAEGEWVKRYQTVATIDRASLQKQLELQLNAYTRERNSFENFSDSQKDKALKTIEERAKQDTQLELNDSVLTVEQQAIALQNTVLSAPFAGILTVAPATSTGVQLTSADYFEIVDPSSLVFRAAVDEGDISQVVTDLSAKLILDAYPETEISTTVSYIAYTSSESSTGTVFIVEFPLGDVPDANKLKIGMNGDIGIELSRSNNTLTVPLDVTKERDGKTYVSVKTGENTTEEREIAVGLSTNQLVEVLSGLAEDDQVLLP